MEVLLQKTLQGYLVPVSEDEAEKLRRIKAGATVRADIVQIRNYRFLKKMHCFFTVCFDYFCEYGIGELEYKGRKVTPSLERFRKDLIILSGHYSPIFNIRGEVRLEADSIAYGNCSEEKAERIYSDCINAALENVYKNTTNEKTLRDMVERILEFT